MVRCVPTSDTQGFSQAWHCNHARIIRDGKCSNPAKPGTVIHFDFNRSAIKSSEAINLTGLLKGTGRNATLILRGYTDSAGSRKYNRHLAARRAKAVRRWLSTHTKQQIRYDIRAYGKCCYARQPGLSPENRRVEIYLKEEEER